MKRINTIIPFCIFCFLSQCSIAESPINTTKDSHESKPLTESLIESKKDKKILIQNSLYQILYGRKSGIIKILMNILIILIKRQIPQKQKGL